MSLPAIGTLFSGSSSDEDNNARPRPAIFSGGSKTDRESTQRPLRSRVRFASGGEQDATTNNLRGGSPRPYGPLPPASLAKPETPVPEGYMLVAKTRISLIRRNTLIQYKTAKGRLIKPKYFKRWDQIGDSIVLGPTQNDRRNYTESLADIEELYVLQSVERNEEDELRGTIEVPKENWKTLRRDWIISYQKKDNEFVYRSKFNTMTTGADGSSRMSFTSERGYSYTANPSNIVKVYRHLTGNDKTLAYILESIRKIEVRLHRLEKRLPG